MGLIDSLDYHVLVSLLGWNVALVSGKMTTKASTEAWDISDLFFFNRPVPSSDGSFELHLEVHLEFLF